jgi:hypothetical protein
MPPKVVRAASKSGCTFCGYLGHDESQCRIKQSMERRKAKNGITAMPVSSEQEEKEEQTNDECEDPNSDPSLALRTVRIASLEHAPSSHKIQLDSAADVHLSGVLSLFTNKTRLSTPVEIRGVNDSSPTIVAHEKGVIELQIMLAGEHKTAVVRDVLYVPSYHGTIISQGVLTREGFDVTAVGCKGNTPGKVTITRHGRLCLQGTQLANSPRTYVDLYMPTKTATVVDKQQESDNSLQVHSSPVNTSSVAQWHARLGHISEETVKHTLQQLSIPFTTSNNAVCETCLLGKMKHNDKQGSSMTRATTPLERVSIDLSGRLRNTSVGGAEYLGVIVDEATSYTHCICARTKDEFSTSAIQWLTFIQEHLGKKVKYLRRDNAGEYHTLSDYCVSHGIIQETTVAGNSFQNGLSERTLGTLERMTRTMMIGAGAPAGFWAEASMTAAFILNHTIHKTRGGSFPITTFLGLKPRLDLIKPFGSAAYALIQDAYKWGAQSNKTVYLGPAANKKGYKLWDPNAHKVVVALHVRFVEDVFPWKKTPTLPAAPPDPTAVVEEDDSEHSQQKERKMLSYQSTVV